jgi:acyloxyacyl hydrolase
MKILFFLLLFTTAWCMAEESIHKPLIDLDDDMFSSDKGFRGANWRGKDGFDMDSAIRPGVKDDRGDGLIDRDCNGISGWNDSKGKAHEDIFCKNSEARGVVMFGDSAAAAFHIPPKWVNDLGLQGIADLVNFRFDGISLSRLEDDDKLSVIEHEFNWPHKSWSTGFVSEINGQSIYLKMRERNLCNHRDFQNLAVNGAKAKSLVEQVGNFSRRSGDKPVLAFIAYIGNDICKKKLEDMTTPAEFRAQMLEGLAALDKKIPAGSKVMLIGLVDGRILWNTMCNLQHPLGMTYAEFYNFLHESEANPCRTWLTPDAESRDKASERALELSAVLKEIVATRKFTNFEMAYKDMPMKEAIDEWTKKGGKVADLIEVVDGFHPSPTCHNFMGQLLWRELETNYPHWLGPVNPHNAEIKKLFGEQGGH